MKVRNAKALGELLKARRLALGISKKRAVRSADISRAFLGHTENGTLATFNHLIEYLNLLGGSLRITFIPFKEDADLEGYLRTSDPPDAKLAIPTETGDSFRRNHPEWF